jgi:hypothetical protein
LGGSAHDLGRRTNDLGGSAHDLGGSAHDLGRRTNDLGGSAHDLGRRHDLGWIDRCLCQCADDLGW